MSEKVNFFASVASVQPILTTTVYSISDAIGPLQSINVLDESTGTGTLLSLTMVDIKAKTPAIDVLFYSQAPGGTITDNSAVAITAADHASYYLGRISIAAADWTANVVAANVKDVTKLASGSGLKLKSTGKDGLIYILLLCVAVPSGAYAAGAGDLTLRIGVDCD